MRHARFAALTLSLLALVSAHAEEPGTDRPYADYYKQLGPAKAADPEDALRILMCLEPASKSDALPADLALEIRDGDHRMPIPLDAKHCFELPANPEWVEHKAVLHKNTAMKLRAGVGISGRLPKSTSLSYAELTASVPAYQRVIASQGLLARMVMPAAKGVQIEFEPTVTQSLVVHAPGSDQRYATDAKGEIHLPYDPALANARVELSAMPKEIGPDS
ncbi:MAG: DUF2987 domain-containing protein [Dokdonella sp.]